jgi:MYXO-CTERM domain-containing protein
MRCVRYLSLPPLLLSLLLPISAFAAPWKEDKVFFTETEGLPSSKVDAADLNGDGYIDLVFANGGGFDKGDENADQAQQAFFNNAGAGMTDVSAAIFKENNSYNGRAVKLRDIDYDGDVDIVLGTTWGSQSQLFLNDGAGNFSNETLTNLPQIGASIGDLELGDVDEDGDLDMVLADWGADSPVSLSSGGVTQLWLQVDQPANLGEPSTGIFEDVTLAQMPSNVSVRWSWDAEFVDVDNDYDLDILVSAYAGDKTSVYLFANDGAGNFDDVTAGNMAQGKNALDVEPMDLNGDGYLDLVTLHDGIGFRNRVLINNKNGGFTDSNDLVWGKLENPPSFDFMGAFYDHDSDKQVDLVLGALQTQVNKFPDRLMLNQNGKFKQWGEGQVPKYQAFEEIKASNGTYALVLADFNKDKRLDVAMAQNENAFEKKILLGTDEIPEDTAPPIFVNYEKLGQLVYPSTEVLRVRCHDNKSPLMLHDFTQDAGLPYLEYWTMDPGPDPDNNPGTKSAPGQWYGEYLWRVIFDVPDADAFFYRICAIDAAGNKACTPLEQTEISGGTETESDTMSSESATDGTVTDTDTTMGASATEGTVTDSDATAGTVTMTQPTESDSGVSASESTPTDTFVSASEADTNQTATVTASESDSDSISDTAIDSADVLDDDGCGCNTDGSPVQGVLSSLALLGLLGLRRRRAV